MDARGGRKGGDGRIAVGDGDGDGSDLVASELGSSAFPIDNAPLF
jgi:hypothetical protein